IGRLHGKISIITGAASGIGFACAQRFLREGSKILMVDSNRSLLETAHKELNDQYTDQVKYHCGNVADRECARDVVDMPENHFGSESSVLVNAAGITRPNSILNTSENELNSVLNVNFNGLFFFCQAFSQKLVKNKQKAKAASLNASIVNISSMAGKLGMFDNANYAASKAAVIGFTKSSCIELGKHGIRTNVIQPGFIQTPMIESMTPEYKNAVLKSVPLRRLGRSDEIANVCLFLASDESSYVNGACFEVSGGMGA
uniref:Uncharacterized protein n=1 Tax=Ciona savignyi TaxID=51511 RepID=H2Y557_CIOSA